MIRLIGRLILVPLGLLLGAFVAIGVLLTIGLETFTVLVSSHDGGFDSADRMIDLAFALFNVAAVATVVPALLVVVVGEVARIRSWLFYVAGGGAALAIIPVLARLQDSGAAAMPFGRVSAILATAGFAGGLVYWLIAGRTA